MNNEKVQALFNSMEIAADELKKATAAANKLRVDNEKEQKITTLIENFSIIQNNSKKLKTETYKAVKRMEKQSSFPKFITFFIMLLFTSIIGLGLGYYVFTTQLESVAYKYHLKKDFGLIVYPRGIAFPYDFKERLGKTDEGVYFLKLK